MTYRAPHRDPAAWGSVILTDAKRRTITIPPAPKMGTARLSVASAIKVDSKRAAGKNGATVTRQGIKDGAVAIDVEIAAQFWPEFEPVLDGIDPRGASVGGPFLVSAPNLPPGFGGLQIKSIDRGSAVAEAGRLKVKISGVECAFPKAGSGPGSGAGTGGKLTAAQIQALQVQIEVLKAARQLDVTVLAFTPVGSGDVYRILLEDTEKKAREIARLQRQVDQAIAELPPPTATTTPTGPGQAYSGAKGPPQSSAPSAGSYGASNPQAPNGAP